MAHLLIFLTYGSLPSSLWSRIFAHYSYDWCRKRLKNPGLA
jgi:hypothetical protein